VRLLVDNCFSRRFVAALTAAGHDVVWVGTWGADPGDAEILRRAFAEQRIVVTRDQDFATLALAYGHLHAGILRIVDTKPRQA
jgi:predicted nuclease of predicted toxin-antitoxin system